MHRLAHDTDVLAALTGMQSPFMLSIGTTIRRWEEDLVELELLAGEQHLNRAGTVHGGVLATLLDHSGSLCGTFSTDAAHARYVATLSMTSNYVAAAYPGKLFATGNKIGGGRRIYHADLSIRNEKHEVIATGTGVYAYRKGSEETGAVGFKP